MALNVKIGQSETINADISLSGQQSILIYKEDLTPKIDISRPQNNIHISKESLPNIEISKDSSQILIQKSPSGQIDVSSQVGKATVYKSGHLYSMEFSLALTTVKEYLESVNNLARIYVGDKTVYHQGNANLSSIDWAAKDLTVHEDIVLHEDMSSPEFISGFAGGGFLLENDAGDYNLTLDNLTIRKSMRIYELLIQQIRGQNGSFWFSDSGKIDNVPTYVSGLWQVTFDTDDGNIAMPFASGDLVRCQKWDGRNEKYYTAQYVYVSPTVNGFAVIDGDDVPEQGDELVRVGNVSDTDRQGSVYITSSDDGAPYIDVLDGVNTASFAGKTKLRLGKLSGITDADFGGALTGYGLYSQNVFLKGKMVISAGGVGGFTATGDKLSFDSGEVNGARVLIMSNAAADEGFEMLHEVNTVTNKDGTVVKMGRIRNLNTNTIGSDYGFELMRLDWTGSGITYKHLVRIDDDSAIIAGWNFDDTSLYSQTGLVTAGAGARRVKASTAGFELYQDFDSVANTDGVIVNTGRIRTNNSLTLSSDYGFEIIKLDWTGSGYTVSHLVRIDKDTAVFSGITAENISLSTKAGGAESTNLKLVNNEIYVDAGNLDGLNLVLNYRGYNGGYTRYRDTQIFNGKQAVMMQWAATPNSGAGEIQSYAPFRMNKGLRKGIVRTALSINLGTDATYKWYNVNTIISLNESGTVTITLPPANNLSENYVFYFHRGSAGSLTIAAAGSDEIRIKSGATAASLAVGTAQTAVVTCTVEGTGSAYRWYLLLLN